MLAVGRAVLQGEGALPSVGMPAWVETCKWAATEAMQPLNISAFTD